MDTAKFRALLRNQAGAVAVITVGAPGDRTGLTATAVCSLSDDPPTVLVCVNRNASAHDRISEFGAFGVNFLSTRQRDIAEAFSGRTKHKGESRFSHGDWSELATGAPILSETVSSLDCRVIEQHAFSTHTIFIGQVAEGSYREDCAPLLYFRGGFCDLDTSPNADQS